MIARFAQEFGGQKLHIVKADTNTQTVSTKAICGRNSNKRGNWRMTINVTLGELCGNCQRFAHNVEIIGIVLFWGMKDIA
jgi:hypothetical protein